MGIHKQSTTCKICAEDLTGRSRLELRMAVERHFEKDHPVAWTNYLDTLRKTNKDILDARKRLQNTAAVLISEPEVLTFSE